MIDTFDSRGLRFTDCYGQRFMRAGVFRYHIVPTGTHCITEERPYSIEVVPRAHDGKMSQHNVLVRNDAATFEPDHAQLQIEVGDMVLWHCPQQSAPPFCVAGDQEFFDSTRLVNECGYSHAFGAAGEYRWTDAHGSGIGGLVRVSDPGCRSEADLRKWRRQLAKGTLVTIAGGKAEPAEVEIVTGQRVFFVVVTGRGMTVTDRRLLGDVRKEPPPKKSVEKKSLRARR